METDPGTSHCAICGLPFNKYELCLACGTCNDCGCVDYCDALSDHLPFYDESPKDEEQN